MTDFWSLNSPEAPLSRLAALMGEPSVNVLKNTHVAVFGVGGVGGFCVEALARSGVGTITIVDKDIVSPSNLNRQIIALSSNIGQPKVEIAKKRINEINPDCKVIAKQIFYLPETASEFNFSDYDYVVDAIDTVTGKIEIIRVAKEAGVPVISCMGAGNKLDATKFEVADISKTSVCPLAKVMRKELKERGIKNVKVVYSKEEALHRRPPGSVAFVPSVAGLIMAGEVIKDLVAEK